MRRLLFVFALTIIGVLALTAGQPTPLDQEVTEAEQSLYDGNAAFTGRFLYEAVKKKPNESAIMSAFSIFTPLAELALYADGDTLTQLLTTLNLPDKPQIREVFPRLVSKLKAEQNVVLNVANRIFASHLHPLSENFLNDTKHVFDAEAENVNFLDAQGAADRINEWVEDQTNKRIKDLASPDMFDEDTRLALVNAIYFLGNWVSPFDVENTIDRPFYKQGEDPVNIPTMYQESRSFKYGENGDLNCKILEMDYKGYNFSFVIFLPNEVDGLLGMVEKLQDPNTFYGAYDGIGHGKVQAFIPKMKVESEYPLIPILDALGITDVFDKRKSILGGMLKKDAPLYVSSANQKAFGLVDEKGTEAAAANIFVIAEITSVRFTPVYRFVADHPFAFYIMNKRNVIFSGIFAN